MESILAIGLPALIVLAVILILASGYVKAPPDKAFIISGIKKEPRILVGRAGIKIPFLERLDKIHLGQMTVAINTESPVPTNDFINVNVEAVAKVRIDPTAEGIKLAAKNFLNKEPMLIAADLKDSLQGNMREIIGTLDLRSINTDRDSFSEQVMSKASKDMMKLGIEIVSCNIQNVTDEEGLIKDLGSDNTAKIKKDASISKAQADKDVAVARAEADRISNDARVKAQTEIEIKNNELEIKKAELKIVADTKKAQADAAYEIQRQAQEKTVQVATVDAEIARAEREAELEARRVIIKTTQLEAEVNKKADADKYEVEQKALAELTRRQKEAEAQRYEKEQGAEAQRFEQEQEAEARKKQAEADRYQAEQDATGIRAKGEAEAEAIRAKGLAEAEAMEKKAEAYQKYNSIAMAEMLIKVLPEMAGKIAEPLSQIDKITIIGGGDSDGLSGVAGNVPTVMAKLFESMKETTGFDLTEVMKAGTYDAKVTKNVNFTGMPESISLPPVTTVQVQADKGGTEESAE